MIIKDIRFLVLVILVAFSLYLIVVPELFSRPGVFVVRIDPNAKCTNINQNSIITQVSIVSVKSLSDFGLATSKIKEGEFVSVIANGIPANCYAIKDGYLGFVVDELKKSNLIFGIDIEGGSRVLLKPKGNFTKEILDETVGTLNIRINLYGLRDIRISPIGSNIIQVEMGGVTTEEITNFLSKQGKFEGKLKQTIALKGGQGEMPFEDRTLTIQKLDGQVEFDNKIYGTNSSFSIEDVEFKISNVTNETIVVFNTIFTGKDIVAVFNDPQNSFINPVQGGYEFVFAVQVSQEGANRFAKLTRNQPTRLLGVERYLEPKLVLFLDNEPVTELNIVASLAGHALTKPSIQGFRESREGALDERLRLQSILKSGSLPVELEIIKTDVVTQTAGKNLLNSTLYVALGAALAVSIVIFFRYRDFKIALPMILISFSEILIILGLAAFTQVLSKGGGWVIDIPAIAGLIAIIGTGVNQLIIITDQMVQEREINVRSRHKIAMTIIFNSAYIVIAAMLPLMIAGVGTLRGFAITTIIGVLIAILITRPAYMAILERVKKLD